MTPRLKYQRKILIFKGAFIFQKLLLIGASIWTNVWYIDFSVHLVQALDLLCLFDPIIHSNQITPERNVCGMRPQNLLNCDLFMSNDTVKSRILNF